MRKFTCFLAFLFSATLVFAQIPNGSTAPDFTTITLDGDTFNLYKQLDAGHPVLMDVSATWCGPCWSYHNTHAFRDTWENHGPDGDDRIRMIMIEGDAATNTNCLYGTTGCIGSTQGNWVAGTPYPIADDAAVSDMYGVNAYPTVFLVCPDRTVNEIGQDPASALWSQAAACPVATGANNATLVSLETGGAMEICDNAKMSPKIKIQNMGSALMTSATATLKYKGQLLETVEWTGSLTTYASSYVSFASFNTSEIGELTAEITAVNGTSDDDTAKNKQSLSVTAAKLISKPKAVIEVRTGDLGRDLYWECRTLDGTVIEKGGNQVVGPNGGGQYVNVPGSGTAYGNNTTNKKDVVLPEAGCYYFHIVSGSGVGLNGSTIKIYDGVASAFVTPILVVGTFSDYRDAHFGTSASFVGIDNLIADATVQLFPNPAHSELQLSFELNNSSDIGFTIVNTLGQKVRTIAPIQYTAGAQQILVPVSDLENGTYFLQLNSPEGVLSKTFTVQK